jgi:hypothetical protein
MAGKAVVKAAKAAVKKADGKKAVKKPAVAKAVKPVKAVAKKPAAKKPTGAKFNFNKLIMLIIRDVPKKGKKMTGGYKKADIDPILNLILSFLNTKKIRERIIKRIEDVYAVGGVHGDEIRIYKDDTINLLKGADFDKDTVKTFLKRMFASKGTVIHSFTNELKESLKYDEAGINTSEKDKRFHNFEFINIVIELCNIYIRYYNNAENTAHSEQIELLKVIP